LAVTSSEETATAMWSFVRGRWFLVVLAVALTVGMGWPRPLAPLADAFPQDLIVAAVIFVMALPLDAHSMGRALRHPQAVLLGVAINYGFLPLVAWGVAQFLRPDLAIGLLIAASIPSTLASAAVWTRRAGGNDAVAILVMMITNLTCFVVTPAWLLVTTGAKVQGEYAEAGAMIVKLLWVAVLPIVLAQTVRLWGVVAAATARHRQGLAMFCQWGVLAMVSFGAVRAGLQLELAPASARLPLFDIAAMIASVVFVHLVSLIAGHLAGRWLGLSRDDRVAVGFAGSQKTLMLGLTLAINYFPQAPILPVVAYHVCQLLVDTVVADWLEVRRKTSAAGPPGPNATSTRTAKWI
jgi:sodium/bile acid cotransporter 7